jgi:hypothetical protein
MSTALSESFLTRLNVATSDQKHDYVTRGHKREFENSDSVKGYIKIQSKYKY